MKNLLTLLLISCFFSSTAQSFTIQNNYLSTSGSSSDYEFAESTYLDALSNGTLFWSIVFDSIPQGWEFSNCFPVCYPAGVLNGTLKIDDIDERLFSENLDTRLQSCPDLIIRTAGEKRLSNFLLWQSAYSELFFSEKAWPDFNKDDLKNAITIFRDRSRKFGGLIQKRNA